MAIGKLDFYSLFEEHAALKSYQKLRRAPPPQPPPRSPPLPAARRGGKAQTEIKEVGGDFLVKSIPARCVCGRSLVKCRHRAGACTL
ncbi:hypothetical protein EVAR_37774_1 [Eumeta japonica]|uniref:Uncharacterized protein n=1 Tax=Eumeta variegata TaxID=151549 RepID=A0A4C1WLP9_EUMVA|nr:hypothetical protein EVAR_37774_1 [Eumeta japonica]